MRRTLFACLPALLAACECGGYPASGERDNDDPPPEVTCAGIPDTPPVELHEVAAGGAIRFSFSPCGHLVVDVDDTPFLASPDLAALAPLSVPEEFAYPRRSFSPTGELLLRSGFDGSLLLDLVTGVELALPSALEQVFFPSHEFDRSLLALCTERAIIAVDRGIERSLPPGVRCLPYAPGASFAPSLLATTTAADRLAVVDLERDTVLETVLPVVESDGEEPTPTPSGRSGHRSDWAFLSPDGSRVFFLQRWLVSEGDAMFYEGTGKVELVETGTGKLETFPGDANGPLGIFRSGFIWNFEWDQTLFVGAAGHDVLDFRCDGAAPYYTTGERMLLSCHHPSAPDPRRDHVVDFRNITTTDLNNPWSVRLPSRNVRAVAGCPNDAWRSGSCTVPVVRRWLEGDEVRDLPLDSTADVLWVGDDGAVLAIATGRDEAILLGPSGDVRTRFPIQSADLPRVEEDGGVLLVKGVTLELLVPETGFHRRLADACISAALDQRGERVAFTVPDGDGFRLLAGAVPR